MTSLEDVIGFIVGTLLIFVILFAFIPVYQDIFGSYIGIIIIVVIGIIAILAGFGEMT